MIDVWRANFVRPVQYLLLLALWTTLHIDYFRNVVQFVKQFLHLDIFMESIDAPS